MTDKEIQSLIDLAQQQMANPISPEEALAIFVEAGILNPDGSFTEHYPTLALLSKSNN
jgi:hypothetical protein